MALDLTSTLAAAQETVESLMTDTCRIVAAPDGVRDDTLNSTTLQLAPVGRTEIYYGACRVSARSARGQTSQAALAEGGEDLWAGRYLLSLPLSALEVPPGSDVTITASRDPWLVGKTLRVIAATGGTLKLTRKIEVELREGG